MKAETFRRRLEKIEENLDPVSLAHLMEQLREASDLAVVYHDAETQHRIEDEITRLVAERVHKMSSADYIQYLYTTCGDLTHYYLSLVISLVIERESWEILLDFVLHDDDEGIARSDELHAIIECSDWKERGFEVPFITEKVFNIAESRKRRRAWQLQEVEELKMLIKT